MAEYFLSTHFLRNVIEWERVASPRDLEVLDRTIAAIAADPQLSGRVRSHYDPRNPSFLFRSGNILIHYRIAADGAVELLSLYHR